MDLVKLGTRQLVKYSFPRKENIFLILQCVRTQLGIYMHWMHKDPSPLTNEQEPMSISEDRIREDRDINYMLGDLFRNEEG